MAPNQNLEKLKRQLAKQKEKERDKPLTEVIVMKKEKVKPLAFVPSQKVMQKRADEETFMREFLSAVKKKEKYLSSIKVSGDDIPYGRAPFISNLQQLDKKNLKKFIKEYLDQSKGYSDFYKKWIMENRERLEELKGDEKEVKEGKEVKSFFDNRDTIYAEMLDRARAWAKQSGVKLSEKYVIEIREPGLPLQYVIQKNQGYEIGTFQDRMIFDSEGEALEWLEKRKEVKGQIVPKENYYEIISNDDSLHEELAEDYIELANVLEIDNPEELKLSSLISSIIEKEQLLASLVQEKLFTKIDNMSVKQLKKEAKKHGLSPELKPKLLKIELLKIARGQTVDDFKSKKESEEQVRAQIKKEKSEGLLRSEILIKLQTLVGAKRKHRKMSLEELENEYQKQLLINKISIITGQDKDTLSSWSLEHLQEHYKTLEEDDSYIDKIQRYNMIEFLVEVGRNREKMEKLSNRKLRKLVDKYKDRQRDKTKIRKRESSSFSWIPYPVTGVWVKPVDTMIVQDQEFLDNESIKGYFLPDEKINVKVGDQIQTYYKASSKFFKHKNKYLQYFKGNVFILKNKSNEKHPKFWMKKFSVGYTVKDPDVGYPVVDSETISLLPLTRELFHKEMKQYDKAEKELKLSLKQFEKSPVDNTVIQIGKEILSSELQKITPQESDAENPKPYGYGINSDFVKKFIEAINTENSTVGSFFTSLGQFIVYLNISKAQVLKKRIQNFSYLPDILAYLSPQEKFPEVFSSTFSEKDQEYYMNEINRRVVEFKNKICKQLYQIKIDPTAKNKTKEILAVFEDEEDFDIDSEYKTSLCENKGEDIPKDQLVFYKDRNKKIYCFDTEKLSKNFTLGDYKNPHTGNRFSKDFIKRCTVNYEGVYYPLKKLQKELASKDNYKGVTFSPEFLKLIRSGKHKYLKINFKTFNRQLELCQNSDDVKDENPENIVFYEEEGNKYCFPIKQIFDMIKFNPDIPPINRYTGNPFSEEFLNRFKKTFQVPLEVKERNVEKDKVLIPDLWNIVLQELYQGKEKKPPQENKDSREIKDEDLKEMFDVFGEDDDSGEKKDKEVVTGFKFKDEELKEESSGSSSIESDFSSDDGSSQSSSGGSEGSSEDSSKGSSESSDIPESPSDPTGPSGPSGPSEKQLSHPTICSYCKKKEGIFKSIGYNQGPITYYFCCPKCMEDFEFVTFKK